jgi:hypothetical protein
MSAAPAIVMAQEAQTAGSLPADQMLRDMLKPSTGATDQAATQPAAAGMLLPQGTLTGQPQLLREGSDVVSRSGHLHKRADSAYQEFVFDNTSGQQLEPMLVLPNRQLMSLENAVSATKRDVRFTVSGTVTEYKKDNYILLDSGPDDSIRRMLPINAPGSTTRPASADQLLTSMLAGEGSIQPRTGKPSPPAQDNTSGSGAVAPNAPPMSVLREQSEIIDRTARLTRSADGRDAELSFESDGSAMRDPPIVILPNLKLAAMEGAAAVSTRDTRFRVTGTVTEYRGRNYIMLEKVVVIPQTMQQL